MNQLSLNVPYGAPCFLTLGIPRTPASQVVGSQCTFWRSVLSDKMPKEPTARPCRLGLNAPFGARYFLTNLVNKITKLNAEVLMHRLALGAF